LGRYNVAIGGNEEDVVKGKSFEYRCLDHIYVTTINPITYQQKPDRRSPPAVEIHAKTA
jgi:hypothetical protein